MNLVMESAYEMWYFTHFFFSFKVPSVSVLSDPPVRDRDYILAHHPQAAKSEERQSPETGHRPMRQPCPFHPGYPK